MKPKQINIDGNRVTISARKAPILISIFLTFFLVVLTLIPLAVTYFALNYGDGFLIGIVFSFILCWGVGFYLLRLIIWNSAGREILNLYPDRILYIADYRLFKDGKKEIEIQDLQTEIVYEDEADKLFGRLRFKTKNTSIDTVLQTKILELEELRNEIKTHYKNARIQQRYSSKSTHHKIK